MTTVSGSEFFGGKPAATAPVTPPTPAPAGGYVAGVKQAASAGIDKAKQGVADIGAAKNPVQLIEGAAKEGAGIIDAASSPLAPLFSPLGKIIGYVSDKLSDHPAVQRFAASPAGEATSRVAEDVGNLDTLASVAVGVKAPVNAVGAATAKVTGATGDLARSVASSAREATSNIMTKASDTVTPLDKGVETILKAPDSRPASAKLSATFERYVNQAQKALEDYSQPTPLELAGNQAGKALNTISSKLDTIGQTKKSITAAIADKPIGNLPTIARRTLRDTIRERTGTVFKADQTTRNAAGRLSSISDTADNTLIKQVDGVLAKLEKAPSFQRADDAVDHIQDLLFKRSSSLAIPINGKVEGALKSVVRQLNDGLRKTGGADYAKFNDAYASTVQVRDILNKALGTDGNKGAALMKQLFSPNGTMPRKLFNNIKQLTGIDLVQEATLAKFAMEHIGDVRQASLLEQVLKGQVPTSKSGLVQMAADKILQKIQDPIGKARRTIGQPSQ